MSEHNQRDSQLGIVHAPGKKNHKWMLFTEPKGQGKNEMGHANSSGNKGDFHFHICKHE